MTFQFRFDAILQLRRRQRDEAGAEVGKAIEALQRVLQQISEIEDRRGSLRQGDESVRVGDLSVDGLLASGRYDMQLQVEAESLLQTHQQLNEELQRRRQRLNMAEAELKKFERLKEKDHATHDDELRRREQVELDEASTRRFISQRQR